MFLNNKGITLIESLIAVMLTAIAIIGLMTMQPLAWQSAGKADSMTRATELLQRELESVEGSIMKGTVTGLDKSNVSETMGNETFTVTTTITEPITNRWLARVNVKWKGSSTGVKSSIIVTRQMGF
ncbi:MAG: type IV pilus modification PilV family protein [Smithellaceae bacterium]